MPSFGVPAGGVVASGIGVVVVVLSGGVVCAVAAVPSNRAAANATVFIVCLLSVCHARGDRRGRQGKCATRQSVALTLRNEGESFFRADHLHPEHNPPSGPCG